ncbi:uncharacterized protein LOC117110510 [Anneissia japonica]|uniref:uncharacterized protein LOC117110510 n=1 Tax=Anneissia japonica TaxID=1529436 RepID=UPI001425885D|nr:uncharacterized protein LOC117110510 [Anneissia japonica]XP_033109147.1 uncharacterized protein LOC117110510 [Anneissia japonica]XP_033109148.1 uncharacterized protein LOC117110510 [Anneissia japonica]XP_033109149.1 uncharacterized protein LOC117110510 [Anneissia japonica]
MERIGLSLYFFGLLIVKDSLGNCIFDDSDILKDRQFLDSNGWTMAQVGTPITCPGYIKAWKWFPSESASFLGLVWRLTNSSTMEYEVTGRTVLPAVAETNKINIFNLPTSEWIPVEAGDIVGFKFDQALIRFDYNESFQIEFAQSIAFEDIVIGSRHTLTYHTGFRIYSFMAIYEEYVSSRYVVETKCKRSNTMKIVEPGGMLLRHVIKSFQRPSAISCVVSCQRNTQCMSLTYEKENQMCHFNNASKEDTSDFIIMDNVLYYEFSYEAIQNYETCESGTVYNDISCWDTRVCRCNGNNGCPFKDWNLVFKGVAGTGSAIYTAFVDGTGTSETDEAASFDSLLNFRSNQPLVDWSSLQITQVKLTLFSESADELLSLIFDGVGSDKTSWYALDRLIISPWTDLTTSVSHNCFSIYGESQSRTFYINAHYGGCSVDTGWLTIIDASMGCPWERGIDLPAFLYSLSDVKENWTSGSIGRAYIMTVHIKYG